MHEIKNLTNSPFDLETLNGPKRLPALGAVSGNFEPAYLASLRTFGVYEVNEISEARLPAAKSRKANTDRTSQPQGNEKRAK